MSYKQNTLILRNAYCVVEVKTLGRSLAFSVKILRLTMIVSTN